MESLEFTFPEIDMKLYEDAKKKYDFNDFKNWFLEFQRSDK